MTSALRVALAAIGLLWGDAASAQTIEVRTRPIERFLPRSDETRFGAFDFVGGFSFSSSDRRLAGISGFRFHDAQGGFLAVSDTGLWFEGRLTRDADGRPSGIAEARLAPILDVDGRAQSVKGDADAEGLALDGKSVLVSFERDHRIGAYAGDDPLSEAPADVAQPIPLAELRSNAGLETIAVSPSGKTIVVAEQSIDKAGNLFAAILGPQGGIFKVRRQPPWHATDGAFLPDGDILLLERRYEGFGRVGMRIRRIAGDTIAVGALVDGPVLLEADLSYEIDNMEALEVSMNAAGETIVSVLSDDNSSFFQRSLYLEFRLVEDGG